MTKPIVQLLDQIDKELEALLEELRGYSNEDLNRQPGVGSWSPFQVMHHLMRAEGLSIQYLKKKLSFNPTFAKAGISAFFRKGLLYLYLAAPIKFKAPKAVSTEFLPEKSDFKEISEQWLSQRKELRNLLDSLPEELFDKEVYKHPFSGRITLEGMLQFHKWHFNRHRKQIRKGLSLNKSR